MQVGSVTRLDGPGLGEVSRSGASGLSGEFERAFHVVGDGEKVEVAAVLGKAAIADKGQPYPALESCEDAFDCGADRLIKSLWRFCQWLSAGPPPQLLCMMRALMPRLFSHARRARLA